MSPKRRVTITIDPELIEAGHRAVDAGSADSISGWVGDALQDKVRRDRRLTFLAAAVADFEAEFGEITADEIAAQQRADRRDAVVVRGGVRPHTRKAQSA